MTSIDLYVDPVCPFAWVTSRWLLDAATTTGRSVILRQMSLAVLNDGRDVAPAQRAKLEWSRRVGRVFAAATDEGGPGAFGDLYEALGALVHNGAGDVADSLVKEALAATSSSPELVDALDDPAWMTACAWRINAVRTRSAGVAAARSSPSTAGDFSGRC